MSQKDIRSRLQSQLDKIVSKNKFIFNSMAAVILGNQRFCWSGVAGLADPQQNIPMTTETPFFIASITKLFTATLIMQLYEQNKLDLKDPISDYLPADLINGLHIYHGTDYTAQIQIWDLLGHRSGIADYYLQKDEKDKSFFQLLLNDTADERTPQETIIRARDKLKANFPPGRKVSYSDTNYQLLGLIIEQTSGWTFDEMLTRYIFDPLDMQQSCLYLRCQPGSPFVQEPAHFFYKDLDLTHKLAFKTAWADGGIISTLGDCLTFLIGLNNGRLFTNTNTLQMMHQWRRMEFSLNYGFGTMQLKIPRWLSPFRPLPELWGHFGSTGTALFHCPEYDLYVAAVTNQVESRRQLVNLILDIIHLVQKADSRGELDQIDSQCSDVDEEPHLPQEG